VGSGDTFGMPVAHAVASGMNGLRAAGDLVARLEMAKGMKIGPAKALVADRLGVGVGDLADPLVMHEVRGERRLGRVFEAESTYPHDPSPAEARAAIAQLLGLSRSGGAGSP
jgi:dimethylamine--corrinoid protein Co-methyltransferase